MIVPHGRDRLLGAYEKRRRTVTQPFGHLGKREADLSDASDWVRRRHTCSLASTWASTKIGWISQCVGITVRVIGSCSSSKVGNPRVPAIRLRMSTIIRAIVVLVGGLSLAILLMLAQHRHAHALGLDVPTVPVVVPSTTTTSTTTT